MLELSIKDLYEQLSQDPDLRRLGEYKVIAQKEKAVFPIELNLEGQDIHLGNGDFREAFTALSKTKARSLDFGNSVFTDLYLDYLEVEDLKFSSSRASRLYFDYAKVKNCNFGNFVAPEVYFDEVQAESIFGDNLETGILYLGKLKTINFDFEHIKSRAHRIALDANGISFPEYKIDSETEDVRGENIGAGSEGVLALSPDDFIQKLRENTDLRRLGRYKVIPPSDNNSLVIDLNLRDKDVNFGDGDFSLLHTSFGDTVAESIDFHNCLFTKLKLGNLQAKRLDFSHSQAPFLDFDYSKMDECFFGDFQGYRIHFSEAEVKNVFGERALTESISLDSLAAEQFNVNGLRAESFMLARSEIREMYLSRGDGIRKMEFQESKLELLNLHEGELKEVNFGNSRITRAMINKSTIDVVHCENLTAEVMFFGNDGKNKIGLLEFGDNKRIKHLELEEILASERDREIKRAAFHKLSFGEVKKLK